MKPNHVLPWLFLVAVCSISARGSFCQEATCHEIESLAKIARTRSTDALSREKRSAGDNYRAQVVFAARLFELRPRDKSAAILLLKLIPQDDAQQTILMTLGDSLCDSEVISDMKSLGRLRDALPRQFAGAVLLVPSSMPAYIAYSLTATLDPHSDYAIHMQRVCRQAHAEFMSAVSLLPSEKRESFTRHILDPKGCRAIALPESE